MFAGQPYNLAQPAVFATTEEAQWCAEEIIALLQRYGVKAEFRQEA